MLRATTDFTVPGAEALLDRLCEHFTEHCEVIRAKGRGTLVLDYGRAELTAKDDAFHASVEAGDDLYLSYMKLGVAEHVVEMVDGPVPFIRWAGDGQTSPVPLFFREMRVVSNIALTPHMRRIRLSGAELSRFADGGLHIRLLFPPKGRTPVWPLLGEDGRIVWPQGEDALEARVYTVRRVDAQAGWLDVDIVLHAGEATPGSTFAETAGPGDIVGMTGPGGGGAPNAPALVLLGDETALPAIARILERLPPEARATAFVEVDGPADEIALASPAAAEIRYLHRGGAPAGTTGLLPAAIEAMDAAALGPDVFVWAGCEFSDFKRIRQHVRRERKIGRERHLVAAYWRRGKAGDEAFAEPAEA